MILDYYQIEKLSSSFIKHFVKKGEPNKEENRNFILGNIVDFHLTEGKTNHYFVEDNLVFPTGIMKKFTDELFKLCKQDLIEDSEIIPDAYYQLAYEASGSKQKTIEQLKEILSTDKTIIQYWDFLKSKLENRDKPIITKEEEFQVLKCINDINNYGKYFNESFLQLEIYTEHFKNKARPSLH